MTTCLVSHRYRHSLLLYSLGTLLTCRDALSRASDVELDSEYEYENDSGTFSSKIRRFVDGRRRNEIAFAGLSKTDIILIVIGSIVGIIALCSVCNKLQRAQEKEFDGEYDELEDGSSNDEEDDDD